MPAHPKGPARVRVRTILLFMAPWLLSLIVFWYGPIFYTVILSFMKYRLIGGGHFIGFHNYKETFTDPFFWNGLSNTFIFTAMFIPANFAAGLMTAWLLSSEIPAKGLFRSIIYVPAVLPMIAILVLGKFLFYPNGLVNSFLALLRIPGPFWLSNPHLIKPTSVLLMIWQCGTAMVIYLGALKAVPGHYYEAAEIDGLNRLGQFMKITIPLISPTIFFRAIMDLIFGLMIFIPGLVLPEGNVPGGPGNASRFYALHLYEKAFQRFNLGEASTLATILIIISFLITFLIMKTSERFVHYEV
jgi:multiple sugar transport system permease protein